MFINQLIQNNVKSMFSYDLKRGAGKMRIHKSRKASLEMSISTIVIVVLAMTLMGLGLVFIRSMFTNITDTAGTVQDQIKQQILEDLRTGDKKISFPTSEVTIGKKQSNVLAVGIKNVLNTAGDFTIEIEDESGVLSSGVLGNKGTFIWDTTPQNLDVNDANVYPIKFTSDIQTGTSIIKIVVSEGGNPYASKTFFLTVQ